MAQEEKPPVFTERTRLSLLQRRILVLDGILDDDNGTLLATQLLTLADEDPDADIALWINSPGGSVPSMLAIRDIMRLVPCDVAACPLTVRRSPAHTALLTVGASRVTTGPRRTHDGRLKRQASRAVTRRHLGCISSLTTADIRMVHQ